MMLSERERAFLLRQRIGHLATADTSGTPTVVPVCFAVGDEVLYTAMDDKLKRTRRPRRICDVETNSYVTFIADRYDEDWTRLGWVMIRGKAAIFDSGEEYAYGCESLRRRYAQYATMILRPVIAIRIGAVRSWGDLDG